MNDDIYWIWLQNALGFGSAKLSRIRFNEIVDFYNAGLDYWISLSLFSKKELIRLSEPVEHFQYVIDRCQVLEYKIVTLSSKFYPFLLKQINNPPIVLYVKGDCSVLLSKCVSMVGSRRASVYGIQMAFDIAHDLAEKGVTVVSGGAVGADSASHRGALAAKGTTICVVACGIDYPYLAQNAFLRDEIARSGAVISEYPPSYPVQSFNFSIRNRIISGMSKCTVIVEAGVRSGSLLTANSAADQGRDVFVIPVKFESYLSKGVNTLISEGAKVITCADDIFSLIDNNEKKAPTEKKVNLEGDELKIFEIVKEKKIHIDEIVKKSKIPVYKISSLLVKLELSGMIVSLPGKFYTKSLGNL